MSKLKVRVILYLSVFFFWFFVGFVICSSVISGYYSDCLFISLIVGYILGMNGDFWCFLFDVFFSFWLSISEVHEVIVGSSC